MANTGYKHLGLGFIPKAGGGTWSDIVIASIASQVSDPISLDVLAGMILTFEVTGAAGSVTQNAVAFFRREMEPGVYQETGDAYSIELETEAEATHKFGISLSSLDYGIFLLEIVNASGVQITTTVSKDDIDVPAAS